MSSTVSLGTSTKRTRTRRWRTWLIGYACVALALSACGSSGGGGSGGDGSAKVTDVTLAFPFFGAGDAPFFLAQQMGFNKAAGINVKFTSVSAAVSLQAAKSGSVQFVYTSTIRPIAVLSSGERFYAAMPVNVGFTEDVLMSKSAYAKSGLTASSTLQDKFQALSGKSLGVISAGGENALVFNYLFHLAGIPATKFKVTALNSPEANLAALKRGSIVGSNLGGTGPIQAVHDGYAEYLLRLGHGGVPQMNKVVSDVVAVYGDYYKKHAAVVKAFTTAYKKAIDYTYAHPTAVADLIYSKYPKVFGSEAKDQFMEEWNALIQYKQLDQSQTVSQAQIGALSTFLNASGQPIPDNWKDVFATP